VRCKFICEVGFVRVNNLCLQMAGGPPTFSFSMLVPRPAAVSEELLAKYERVVVRALGIEVDQVISTLDKPAGLGTGSDESVIEIYFVTQVRPHQVASALYAEVAGASFAANLAAAAASEGLPAGYVAPS